MVNDVSELGHISHRCTIGTSEWRVGSGQSDVEIFSGGIRAQLLEEGKEILGISAGHLVTADGRRVWIFPAKT